MHSPRVMRTTLAHLVCSLVMSTAALACGDAATPDRGSGPGSGGANGGGAAAGGSGGLDCGSASTCLEICACSGVASSECLAVCQDGPSGSGGNGGSGTAGTGGGTAGGGSAGVGGNGGAGGAPPSGGLESLGTLIVLGDSIGDGGGVPPYYYDLLRDSLSARYGALAYERRAHGGSHTSALAGQVSSLPASLPGPVAVAITSGGNDMKDDVLAVASGMDGPLIAQMGANIGGALDSLLAPGRFGAGVEVHVYEANVYDATDGQGNFNEGGCNVSVPVVLPTDPFFAKWNTEIATQVTSRGQTLVDIHARFYGHGFNNPPNWYASDCTHPNASGHDQLRRYFYELITGEELP